MGYEFKIDFFFKIGFLKHVRREGGRDRLVWVVYGVWGSGSPSVLTKQLEA